MFFNRKGMRTLLVAAVFWHSVPSATSKTDDATLRAMRSLPFVKVSQGDSATIKVRNISFQANKDNIFELSYKYRVVEALGKGADDLNAAYVVEVRVAGGGKPGTVSPPGYDEAVQKLFPPVQLRMNRLFEPMAVINWPDVERQQKRGMKDMAGINPALKRLILPLLLSNLSQDIFLEFMKPITLMQNFERKDANGVFVVSFDRKQGDNIVLGVRSIVPHSQSNDGLRATFDTSYDTSKLTEKLKSSQLGKFLSPNFAMVMKSTGDVTYDRESGWVRRYREEITIETLGTKKPTAPRVEIIEMEQVRDE